jgi:hypothetical protein
MTLEELLPGSGLPLFRRPDRRWRHRRKPWTSPRGRALVESLLARA